MRTLMKRRALATVGPLPPAVFGMLGRTYKVAQAKIPRPSLFQLSLTAQTLHFLISATSHLTSLFYLPDRLLFSIIL